MARTTLRTPFWTRRRVVAVSLVYWALLLGTIWYLPWAKGRAFRAQCERYAGVMVHPDDGLLEARVEYTDREGVPQQVFSRGERAVSGTPYTVLVPRDGSSAFVEGTDSWFDYASLDLFLVVVLGAGVFRVFRISIARFHGAGPVILPGGSDGLRRSVYPKGYSDE